MPIKDGDLLWIVYDHKRKWLLRARTGENFQTHLGIIKYDDIIGKEYGFKVVSNTHAFFWVFEPLPIDVVVKMGRATQIIYPQDIGFIIVQTGIGPGKNVVEAGTGSGALTINLAYYARPDGHIYSYDINEKSTKQAQKNLERMNLASVVTLKTGDVCQSIEEKDADVVMLDLATPWLAIETAWGALKEDGIICCFSPTIEQVKKNVDALKRNQGFVDIRTQEVLCQDYQVRDNATRPVTTMIGHTGFMTFARKVVKGKNANKEKLNIPEGCKDAVRDLSCINRITYPQDLGFILVQTGIGPDKKVVAACTGNGSLTRKLAYYVRPHGHIYSYDTDEKNSEQMQKNLDLMNLSAYATLKIGDACLKIEEKQADVVLLEIDTPWLAIETAWDALKGSGIICSFSPTIEQVQKNVEALKKSRGFADIRTHEILCRDYHVQENDTHPTTAMIGHTGFITFARKVIKEEITSKEKPNASESEEETTSLEEGEKET